MRDDLAVSCLCVTRNRVPLLQRSVACFLKQTYPHRELIVVYEADDWATRDYLAKQDEPSIRPLQVPAEPRLQLGLLRNLAIEASMGRYVAQWDDDDWHGPARLAEQIKAIEISGKPACVLSRWVIYDAVNRLALLSAQRAWEGSLVATRSMVPAYADLSRGEDTPVIVQMLKHDSLTLLDRPDLYVYVYHGANTWDRSHFEKNLLQFAQPLARDVSERVGSLLAGESESLT